MGFRVRDGGLGIVGLRVKGGGAQGVDSSKISATHGRAAHIVAQTAYQHPEKGEPRMAKRVDDRSFTRSVSLPAN